MRQLFTKLGVATMSVAVACGGAMLHYLHTPDFSSPRPWQDLGVPPGGDERYPPQGMTLIGDRLVFSNHWNDTKSGLYLLECDTMRVLADAVMPEEAVHTSGLGWDGETLWAVDYRAKRLYALDMQATFERGEAVVTDSWPTGLSGPSALTVVPIDGVVYLAISDFLGSSRTYLIRRDQVDQLDTHGVRDLAVVSYRNGSFSQGLTWDGAQLYEAVGNRGVDRIEVYRITEALRSGDSEKVQHLGSFAAAGTGVEDLATDGQRLWTSDEGSYHWYVLPDLPAAVGMLEHSAD